MQRISENILWILASVLFFLAAFLRLGSQITFRIASKMGIVGSRLENTKPWIF